jgi:hypothetical protein
VSKRTSLRVGVSVERDSVTVREGREKRAKYRESLGDEGERSLLERRVCRVPCPSLVRVCRARTREGVIPGLRLRPLGDSRGAVDLEG